MVVVNKKRGICGKTPCTSNGHQRHVPPTTPSCRSVRLANYESAQLCPQPHSSHALTGNKSPLSIQFLSISSCFKMAGKGFLLLLWVFAIHLSAIYLYTRGFLLSRLSLSEKSSWNNTQPFVCSHKRAVLLVIDALRYDFISPDPPHPPSPYHHNVLRLPAELTKEHPDRSFVFTSFADPPTTTLQRIKGITTGSLPTFIDMGSNFGGSSNLEDSFISQLSAAGKRVRNFLFPSLYCAVTMEQP